MPLPKIVACGAERHRPPPHPKVRAAQLSLLAESRPLRYSLQVIPQDNGQLG
ncbi:hypothetical protein [Microcoleus sp. CAWBG58]|uniref:hypothetical protein n=1 Tax=Microcoleus sp. CAWBG58 TaxID=2841651 RepID=UPI0025E08816|nr:hypothetical protein [Microcoleus sp. CAWBG58]